MEQVNEKVLDKDEILVLLKRKRSPQDPACFHVAGSSHVSLLRANDQLCDCCGKRTKLDDCLKTSPCYLKKSILRNFSNFMKSGFPKRLLFFQSSEWKDYPADMIGLVRQDFQAKKAITEVNFQGHQLLFDFVHMVQIDSETGLHKKIAWIDENGNCFFPELFMDVYDSHGHGRSAEGEYEVHECHKAIGRREIKMQMEVPANPALSSTSKDNEDTILNVKRVKTEEPAGFLKLDRDIEEAVGENDLHTPFPPRDSTLESLHAYLARVVSGGKVYAVVRDMLLLGMHQLIDSEDIIGIFHIPQTNILGQTRLKDFQKQVVITQSHRGSAHVRYGWLATSKAAVKDIMLEGPGKIEMPKYNTMYGIGVHLAPANHSNISASCSDVDENGIIHMVLCRVILGKLECVPPGSKQFRPSSESFDNGIDNFENPNCYIIWNMHVNSHILPEYVVSLRVPAKGKEWLVGKGYPSNVSDITSPSSSNMSLKENFSNVCLVGNSEHLLESAEKPQGKMFSGDSRMPTSPWMPFSMLFAALSTKITSQDMDLLNKHYDDFKRQKISKIELLKKLRQIVGDNLLLSTAKHLQHKVPPMARPALPVSGAWKAPK